MAEYSIDSKRIEVFVEARSNVHPIEIRTQGLRGFIDVVIHSGFAIVHIDEAAVRQSLAFLADYTE